MIRHSLSQWWANEKMRRRHKAFVGVLSLALIASLFVLFSGVPVTGDVIFNPPSFHQFYGTISYPSGYFGSGDVKLVVTSDGITIKQETLVGSSYGVDTPFVIEDLENGELLTFSLQSLTKTVQVATRFYSSFGYTELNLAVSGSSSGGSSGGGSSGSSSGGSSSSSDSTSWTEHETPLAELEETQTLEDNLADEEDTDSKNSLIPDMSFLFSSQWFWLIILILVVLVVVIIRIVKEARNEKFR